MGRAGYTDDCDENWSLIRWRGAVKSALRGKKGQAFLRELITALDAMPEKSLTSGELQADGEFCALGVVGHHRGIDLARIDTESWEQLSKEFGIAEAMAREIMFENDEVIDDWEWKEFEICGPIRWHYERFAHEQVPIKGAAERRWRHMREWAASQLKAQSDKGAQECHAPT